MPGIIIPGDRTTRQIGRGYCLNPECRGLADRFEFPVENDLFCCPKCRCANPPTVGLLVLTHFLVADPQGPIVGAMNTQYRLACHQNRAYLATATNMEAATGDPAQVNCPGCMRLANQAKVQGFQLTQ